MQLSVHHQAQTFQSHFRGGTNLDFTYLNTGCNYHLLISIPEVWIWKFYKTGIFLSSSASSQEMTQLVQINFKNAVMLLKPKVKPTLAEYKPKYTEFSGSIFYLLIPNQHCRDVRQKLSKAFIWQIREELYHIKLYLYII